MMNHIIQQFDLPNYHLKCSHRDFYTHLAYSLLRSTSHDDQETITSKYYIGDIL